MSEMHDRQEVSGLHTQPNEVQTQANRLSQNSDNGQALTVKKTDKQDEHPFTGPKLHLFKKGQSKSSQMKQRNIKTSEKLQRPFEVQQNVIYSQQDAHSNHGGFY